MSEGQQQQEQGSWRMAGEHLYQGCRYLPFMGPDIIEAASAFPALAGDVLFGTYPRSGTPLIAELMYMVYHQADLEAARATVHGARIRFLEHMLPNLNPVEMLKAKEPPRLLKTHLPATFYPTQLATTGVKAVVMIRDPRDVLVSYFKFYTANPGYVKYPGTWDEYFELFKQKQLYGGDWFEHTKSWLAQRNKDGANVLLLKYEELRETPEAHVRKVAEFCGRSLSDEQVERAARYLMEEVAEECVTGAWRDYFSPEQDRYFSQLYQQQMAGHTDLTYS